MVYQRCKSDVSMWRDFAEPVTNIEGQGTYAYT